MAELSRGTKVHDLKENRKAYVITAFGLVVVIALLVLYFVNALVVFHFEVMFASGETLSAEMISLSCIALSVTGLVVGFLIALVCTAILRVSRSYKKKFKSTIMGL